MRAAAFLVKILGGTMQSLDKGLLLIKCFTERGRGLNMHHGIVVVPFSPADML